MTDPFYPAKPGDPISAEKWNDMQVKMRDELANRISAHTHTGGGEGRKLTGEGIDPTSLLKVNQLDAAVSLSVKNIDVFGRFTTLDQKNAETVTRLNGLDQQKLSVTGGTLTGGLTVSGLMGVGTTGPTKQLTVDYTGARKDHATMEVRQPGNASWGVALVVRTTGGIDGASVLWRSRNKSWQLRGESGATSTGFQLTEDGGDAEYGSGAGSPRLHVSAGGNVGIGTTAPLARLDVQSGGRTDSHTPERAALYVTGDFTPDQGVEFRHSNGTQGLGFGYNTVYATGSNPNQDLNLKARGSGVVRSRVDSGYMQLMRTATATGKAMFLELYQPNTPADVYPSIRFHHEGRHWSRLETSNELFHFKVGDVANDAYVDVAARRFLVGGVDPAVSSQEQIRIVRGFVPAGSDGSGTGFTWRWLSESNGVCEVGFNRPFAIYPTVVATQQYVGNNNLGADTRDNAVITGSWNNKMRVKTGDGNGNGARRDFFFIAMGT